MRYILRIYHCVTVQSRFLTEIRHLATSHWIPLGHDTAKLHAPELQAAVRRIAVIAVTQYALHTLMEALK